MPGFVSHDAQHKLICVRYLGEVNLSVLKNGVSDGLRMIIEFNCFDVLVDLTEAEIDLSTMERYELPEVFSRLADKMGLDIRRVRRAILVRKLDQSMQFSENVMINQGQNARVFDDIDRARRWLADGSRIHRDARD